MEQCVSLHTGVCHGNQRTQTKYINVGQRCFCRKGLPRPGVADIIDKAGIARGTFYLYFKSKRDVFSALIDYTFDSIRKKMTSVETGDPLLIIPGVLKNIDVIRNFFFNDPEMAKIIIREAVSLDAESSDRVEEIQRRLADWLTALISQWQELGILRKFNPQIITYIFIGSMKELFQQYLISGNLQSDSGKIIETLITMYLFGIIRREIMSDDHPMEEVEEYLNTFNIFSRD